MFVPKYRVNHIVTIIWLVQPLVVVRIFRTKKKLPTWPYLKNLLSWKAGLWLKRYKSTILVMKVC